MAEGSIGYQENLKFLNWLKQKKPGVWAPDKEMATKDLQSLYLTDWQEWVTLGRPTRYTAPTVSVAPTIPSPPELSDEDKALLKSQGLSDAEIQERIDASKAATQQGWIALAQSQVPNVPQWRPGELEWLKEQSSLARIKEQHDLELQFEQDRNRLIQGLPSDDWIRRWVIQNQPNPYKVQEVSPVDQLEKQLDTQTASVQSLQANLTQANLAKNWELADKIREELTEATRARDTTYKDWNAMKQENINWSPQVPQPYPNAPGWLPQYAPGTISGQMITKQSVVTPSGQQLTQMPSSRAGQLGAYADWVADYTGNRQWRDILAEAKLMLPNAPSSRFRWSPVET